MAAIITVISRPIFGQTNDNKERKFHFFGSYNIGFGHIISKVQAGLLKPESDEVNKLRNGSINQLEFGLRYKSFGIAYVYNHYQTSASTGYSGYDLNYDGLSEDGQLNDKFHLKFMGCTFLYKFYFLKKKFDITYKYSLGWQKYLLAKQVLFYGFNGGTYKVNIEGSKFSQLIGLESNFHFYKFLSLGIEASYLPGKFNKLTYNGEEKTLENPETVNRLNYGVKLSIEL